MNRADHHVQFTVSVDIGERGGPQGAVPVLAAAGQTHGVQQLAQVVEDNQLPGRVASLLVPGGENHFGLSVAVQVRHYRFRGEAEKAFRGVGHLIGPVAVLGAVQPVGVDPPVIGGVEDFLETVAVQVDHHRVGLERFR